MGIKGLFFKEEESAVKTAETKKTEPTQTTNSTLTLNTIGATGTVDDKFVKMLLQLIADNNLPGMDYFELKQSIDAMSSLSIDETNKFLGAYAILSGQGCTKETLLSSLDKYVGLIQNERANFDNELKNQYDSKVKQKMNAVEKAKLELEQLNVKIRETNDFIITANQEIQQEEGSLKLTAENFNKSVQHVLGNLENDKNKIINLIK